MPACLPACLSLSLSDATTPITIPIPIHQHQRLTHPTPIQQTPPQSQVLGRDGELALRSLHIEPVKVPNGKRGVAIRFRTLSIIRCVLCVSL